MLPEILALGHDASVADDVNGARAVESTWEPTRRDLGRAMAYFLGGRGYYLFAALILVVGLPGPILLMTTGSPLSLGAAAASAVVVLYFAVTVALYPRNAGRSAWKVNPLARVTERVRVDAGGVTTTSELATFHLEWKAVAATVETERFVAFTTVQGPGATVVCLSKAGLTSADLATVRALIAQNVGPLR